MPPVAAVSTRRRTAAATSQPARSTSRQRAIPNRSSSKSEKKPNLFLATSKSSYPPLDRKVSLKFQNTPLVEALQEVCSLAGMQLELDLAALTGRGLPARHAHRSRRTETHRSAGRAGADPQALEKLSFTVDTNQVCVSTRDLVEAREKQIADPKPPAEDRKGAATAPPKGLEFLTPYPGLHGLSLDMSEKQFLEIVKTQALKNAGGREGETFPVSNRARRRPHAHRDVPPGRHLQRHSAGSRRGCG